MAKPDTPTRSKAYVTYVDGVRQKDLREHLNKATQRELSNMFTVSETRKLFDTVLDVDSNIVDAIFDDMVADGFYNNEAKTWKGLPCAKNMKKPSGRHENDMYDPFAELANHLNTIINKKFQNRENNIEGTWINCNFKNAKSKDSSAASVRPDIARVSKRTNIKWLRQTEKKLRRIDRVTIRLQAGTEEDNSFKEKTEQERDKAGAEKKKSLKEKKEQERDKRLHFWWAQIESQSEFKYGKTQKDFDEALGQLCNYVKRTFREQLDRRFMIAFTLCLDKLNVYLFDRSGVVASQTSINIHENPKMLVQLLAAQSILPPERLGYDTTMEVYHNTHSPMPSYKFPWATLDAEKTAYDTQWVISFKGEMYITIRTLSIVDVEIMCGRATAVWEVVRFDDFMAKKEECKVFVLKQSWQRLPGKVQDPTLATIPFEYFAHQRVPEFKERIFDSAYVCSQDGRDERISTFHFIRKGIQCNSILSPLNRLKSAGYSPTTTVSTNKRSRTDGTMDHTGSCDYQALDQNRPAGHPLLNANRAIKPVSRTQTRILMATRGFPLKYAKSWEELLWVLLGAVLDHWLLYHAGVLHRDISHGNIVIALIGESICGRLIDLDHAKVTADDPPIPVLQTTLSIPQKMMELAVMRLVMIEIFVTDDTVNAACAPFLNKLGASPHSKAIAEACEDGINYLRDVHECFGLQSSESYPLTPKDLHWDLKCSEKPSFHTHQPGDGNRTGTQPFMSFQIVDANTQTAHDAIHDIESFFWVLIHIMLTRNGPGGSRRDISEPLDNVLNDYFYSSIPFVLANKKGSLFTASKSYNIAEKNLLDLAQHVNSYFEPLTPLIKKWWNLLYFAYKYEAYELWDIHANTMRILREEIANLPSPSPVYAEQTIQEEGRREAYHQNTHNAIKSHTIAQRPSPPTPVKRERMVSRTETKDPSSSSDGHRQTKRQRRLSPKK